MIWPMSSLNSSDKGTLLRFGLMIVRQANSCWALMYTLRASGRRHSCSFIVKGFSIGKQSPKKGIGAGSEDYPCHELWTEPSKTQPTLISTGGWQAGPER
ncbi:hypothetical protein D3C75_1206270 [compost metagenome]